MGGERPRIGEDRVELAGPHGLHVRFEANYAVIGKDDDLARHLTEVATNEGGALILERKAKARRNSVRRDEGLVDADRVEERAYARPNEASRRRLIFARGQEDLYARRTGKRIEHRKRVGDDRRLATGSLERLGEVARAFSSVDEKRLARPHLSRRRRPDRAPDAAQLLG